MCSITHVHGHSSWAQLQETKLGDPHTDSDISPIPVKKVSSNFPALVPQGLLWVFVEPTRHGVDTTRPPPRPRRV